MWISDFAITRPIVTIVTMLALVLFGIVALFVLDVDEFPEISPPVVSIAIPYPGAGPTIVERELVTPVEDAIAGISGVDRITSTSLDGFAFVVVEFVFEKDLNEATQEIRDAVSEIRNDLPLEMEEPILTRFDPNDLPIVSVVLSSDRLTPAELTRIADPGIVGELQAVSGVAQVDIVGGVEPELTVALSPDRLQAAGISVGQVVQALQGANLAAPVGRLNAPREEQTIRLEGRLPDAAAFEDIAVGGAAGRIVRLGEVADVSEGTIEARSLAYYDGRRGVGIEIVKNTNASTTTVSDAVRERLDALEADLPEGVRIDIVRDAGVRVHESVTDVQRTLFEGAALTVAVVFLFLGSWRSTVITGLALPVSVLASFIMVWAWGYTLNTMSLLGLSLAIGILVDDAIVVRENIVRHMEMGKDHLVAAHEGTAEIGLAVAATTFSIVVVFVPIAYMGGVAEQWLGPMALTIASSVMVSLLVSFSLDPMLSAYWPDPEIEKGERKGLGRLLQRFERLLERGTRRYERLVGWALDHPWLMLFVALASFAGALALPALGFIGSGFLPDQDRSEITLSLEMPPGASLEYTSAKALQAAEIAREHPEVLYTFVTVGGQGESVDEAEVYVRLAPKAERDLGQEALTGTIRDEVARLAGVTVSVSGGFGPQKQIELQVQGPDVDVLTTLAERIAAEVEQVPGAVDVGLSTRGSRPEVRVDVSRDIAASLGLSVGQIAQALRPAFAGIDVGDWVDPTGETRDVRVRLAPEARERASDLSALPLVIPGVDGASTLPLGQVADVSRGRGPAQIQHLDRERVVTVGANVRGYALSEVTSGIDRRLDDLDLPPGYAIVQGGDVEAQQEVFGRMGLAMVVAIALMYLILVIQFGSFLDPVPILASLPLSLIGVMLALLVTGSTLNLMSLIGVLLLMGIVAKNAILLVDFAKWANESGMSRRDAIIQAGGVRLRPILMTSVAIIAGMFPVALGLGEGADFRAPLGRAVIGGVITSTILTLLVIPTFWNVMAGWRESVIRRLRGAAPVEEGPAEGPLPAK